MRYKLLGRSGLRVSELCLGTMTFGEEWGWGSSRDESRKVYDAFRSAGGNFIDTANVYTNGTSETLLGEFMQGHRHEIVLATKYTNALAGTNANAAGNHRKSMMEAVHASLKRLKTEYIDLYWLHIWDTVTPIEEVMRAFDDLVRQGKILYTGISDTPAWVIARGQTLAELRGWSPFIGLQIEYSLIERTVERELTPMAHELGLGITAWSPLASGLLTGKGLKTPPPATTRLAMRDMEAAIKLNEKHRAVTQAVVDVARELGGGATAAQVAINWLLRRSFPVIPILGARTVAQLEDNMKCTAIRLSDAHLARLDEVSRIEMGFPHDFLAKPLVRSLSHGGMRDLLDA